MMISRKNAIVMLMLFGLAFPLSIVTSAQTGVVVYPSHLDDVPDGMDDTLADILAADNPCPDDCTGFAITDISGTRVSVAGVSDGPDWDIYTDLVWTGQVIVYQTDVGFSGEIYQPEDRYAPAGNDTTFLPFPKDTWGLYGMEGVHGEGDWGLDGWIAVDFFSGDDRTGNGGYPNMLYASQTAEVTWVCRDSNNVAFHAGDFRYLHLDPSANIQVGDSVYRGYPIAPLATGTWSNVQCGYSAQAANHWHVHLMTPVRDGLVQIEDWVLNVQTERFTNLVTGEHADPATGIEPMTAYWSDDVQPPVPTPGDGTPTPPPPGTPPGLQNDSLWSALLNYMIGASNTVRSWFPAHQETNLVFTFLNTAGVAIRIVYVMMVSNFNFFVPATVLAIIFLLEPLRIMRVVYMAIKEMVPGA